jgi:hypothetical protein
MLVIMPRTKTDQCGESSFHRSIFANPLDPVICPILSFAVALLSHPHHIQGGQHSMFEGRDQEDRYSKLLASVLENLPESMQAELGAKRSDIGTHSARKGAPTYALSMPGGPSPVSVFLRAGWSLGNVKDRYIFEGDGADQVSHYLEMQSMSYLTIQCEVVSCADGSSAGCHCTTWHLPHFLLTLMKQPFAALPATAGL